MEMPRWVRAPFVRFPLALLLFAHSWVLLAHLPGALVVNAKRYTDILRSRRLYPKSKHSSKRTSTYTGMQPHPEKYETRDLKRRGGFRFEREPLQKERAPSWRRRTKTISQRPSARRRTHANTFDPAPRRLGRTRLSARGGHRRRERRRGAIVPKRYAVGCVGIQLRS